jgi:HAD superfamily hydrolase (TIGR01484 family)
MKPLSALRAGGVRALLFDIDDTLTTEGRLTAEAYAALEALKRAGRIVVPVTGRPAGWCDHIARMWPVDAVVGENGAFYYWFDGKKLQRRYFDENGASRKAELLRIGETILRQVPGTALAADQAWRETDLAIDFREDVPALPLPVAERVATLMREAGLTAKVSSIHVNGWFGGHDKLAMSRRVFAERFALDLDAANASVAFIGDSPNDEPMFGFFENSVGVANVRDFRLSTFPGFVTAGKSGKGFVELAEHLLK